MFTGIIEEIGKVENIIKNTHSFKLIVKCKKVIQDVSVGDSIAVNGACLTVTEFGENSFSADVTSETMRRTAFSLLQIGTEVNLERALSFKGRLGGHIVLGHVDCCGKIISERKDENAVHIKIETEEKWFKYIIEKGSIAVDGISLTISEKSGKTFIVTIIPHTGIKTTLLNKKVGDMVNLECDYLGKFVEQLINKSNEKLTMKDLELVRGKRYGI
ncbi:riboflavin synthase [Dialister micraerophilus]|uniref:Riboflavin synthase n=1 Tax=Dialister micraerophilus DSM 19965 TaxID=888062 RepID=F2BY88_9FIRM|nr:riboflavin synthase [Dialister micraerophilus]EGF12409.1 riboflavin synthase subunit alpha [Dialister micraerophilus DSM 19965]